MGGQVTIVLRRCGWSKCRRTLRKKASESAQQYGQRKYCGQPCWHAARLESNCPARSCRHCGTELVRRDLEPNYSFRVRKYCGPDCIHAHARKRAAERSVPLPPLTDGRCCAHCQAELVRHVVRRPTGLVQVECTSSFERRLYCGRPCQYADRKGRKVGQNLGKWPRRRTPIMRDEQPDWAPTVRVKEIKRSEMAAETARQQKRGRVTAWGGW